MKAIFDVGHPAHVHLFKNTILSLQKLDWEVKIVVRPKEITLDLLKSYGLDFIKLNHYDSTFKKAIGMFRIDFNYFKFASQFLPDVIISAGSPYSAHISRMLKRPHITFIDTPTPNGSLYYLVLHLLCIPFTKIICTPNLTPLRINPKKQIMYNGCHELAYLHPNYFKADASVLKELGLTINDKFVIMRFASWNAIHDIGQRGVLSIRDRIQLVKQLENNYKVILTSEIDIPELKKYEIHLAPEKIHSLLAFATIYIGEGATMASEAGVLGVPWIFLYRHSFPNLDEQEKKYGLGFVANNINRALEISNKFINSNNLKAEWNTKKEKLLNDKIDVTYFITRLIIEHNAASKYKY